MAPTPALLISNEPRSCRTEGSSSCKVAKRDLMDHGAQALNEDTCETHAMAPSRVLPPGRSFTLRGIVAGLGIGTIICAANVYFGLQTGWVSIMSMPASLMGFGIFKLLRPHLRFPFTPIENVFVQSVACGMAIMPLGCGLVGVIPAMDYLLKADEQGPFNLSMLQLVVWSLGLCYFGVVFAVPLRHQVIIRERLRFPSGFSTAVLISVLHGKAQPDKADNVDLAAKGGFASLALLDDDDESGSMHGTNQRDHAIAAEDDDAPQSQYDDGASNMRLLVLCFFISGFLTVLTYFVPVLRNIPIFGPAAADVWLWTLNPSLAYVGQGIIMGTETTLHMLLGAVVGWGILSPLAKAMKWAPGPVDDWEHGSKGWIVWVSLAIMLVDAVISLSLVAARSVLGSRLKSLLAPIRNSLGNIGRKLGTGEPHSYSLLQNDDATASRNHSLDMEDSGEETRDEADSDEDDAPADQRIGKRLVVIGLISSILVCIATTHFVFGDLVPLYATITAVLMALVLSVMGVRALGETDLNPVSGISKLAQLFFALIIPQSNKSSVLINLVAGAVSEAGALQAADLMQDLKTGHLLGAAPSAQFWGQVIGATAGAVFSAFMYRLYTSVYTIPGDLFQVPTAYVWIFTARLVTGKGLPYMAKEWALGAGAMFACTTLTRTLYDKSAWRHWVPGGIAVAVGMYNVPSFTLARTAGGFICWYWLHVLKRPNTKLIIIASGFILGEGFLSIANLILQGLNAPHL